MFLNNLLKDTDVSSVYGDWNISVSGVCCDSRSIEAGNVFICIRGVRRDGHRYIDEAVRNGASAVVIEGQDALLSGPVEKDICIIVVNNTRLAAAQIAAVFYGYPSRKLTMIGVTGTKGKTTTTMMIQAILAEAGYKTGILGTIKYDLGGIEIPSERTTPEAVEVQRYLKQMVDNGCKYVVMEISSQGLKMMRTVGICFDTAVFLNLSKDHIGFGEHRDMDEYAQCKALLFKQSRLGIGNKDDPWYNKIVGNAGCRKITFSCTTDADFKADNIMFLQNEKGLHTLFMIGETEYEIAIPGVFSVYNALAAIAVCSHYGIESACMQKVLQKVSVKGRAEIVPAAVPFGIMIDYAHNAISLQYILMSMRRYHPKRLIVLFGCGGGRSRSRRQSMGLIAGKYADFSVITSDNPRDEEPETIIREIEVGMKQSKGDYITITDRKEAIRWLLTHAHEGDFLIIAGKGHEMVQEIKGCLYPFDERMIIRNILADKDEPHV